MSRQPNRVETKRPRRLPDLLEAPDGSSDRNTSAGLLRENVRVRKDVSLDGWRRHIQLVEQRGIGDRRRKRLWRNRELRREERDDLGERESFRYRHRAHESLSGADRVERRAISAVAVQHVCPGLDGAVVASNERVRAKEPRRADHAGARERVGGRA